MHISTELKHILEYIKNDSVIANYILNNDHNSDVDYLDISHSDNNKISYTTKERLEKFYKHELDPFEDDNTIWTKNRYHIKPGKIIRKITNKTFHNTEIEQFSSFYKSMIVMNDIKMTIIKGDEIKQYFMESSYIYNNGSISKSCMRHPNTQPLIDFYCKNENISLLIGKTKDGHIIGRSLLWKTIEGFDILDRVYTISPTFDHVFYFWSKRNNYYRKRANNWYDTTNFISPNNTVIELLLSVKLNNSNMKYPYLDTFKWLSDDNVLYNHLDNKTKIVLSKLDGTWNHKNSLRYDDIDHFYRPQDSVKYCKYKNINTHKDRLFYSSINGDFIFKDDSNSNDIFGFIFNTKYDKYNKNDKMLKFLYSRIYRLNQTNELSDIKFDRYKKIFNNLKQKYVSENQ